MFKPARPEAYKLLHSGVLALSDVEANGMRVDVKYLHKTMADVKQTIGKLEDKLHKSKLWKNWRKEFGTKANLGSREQLAHMVFNVMGYENTVGVTEASTEEKVRWKADKAAFDNVDHPFVKEYLRNEKLKKAHGTYLKGILRELVGDILRPCFDLYKVRTYRSSCSAPNFQNIPVRDPLIKELIRKCFIARDGHQLIENDFGGIEVRCAACYHKDKVIIDYLTGGGDMHRDFAADLFMCKPDKVSDAARYVAKNMFVFPEFYGSYYALVGPAQWAAMENLKLDVDGIPMREWMAKKGITKLGEVDPTTKRPAIGTYLDHVRKIEKKMWDVRFTIYRDWKKKWYNDYLKEGGYHTLTGFRIEGHYGRNDVINHPVQGTAFHWLLWTLIELNKWLKKEKMRSMIVGQVHDSINSDVHCDERDAYIAKVQELTSDGLRNHWKWINVPVVIECEESPPGGSWYDKKKVELN